MIFPQNEHDETAYTIREQSADEQENRKWYVVKTKPREEQLCIQEMDRREIKALCPMTRIYRYRRRRQEIVPLFPGYLFVNFLFPDCYDTVRWARGVSNLVRFGKNDPPAVENEIIEFFSTRMDEKGVVNTSVEFIPGQKVQFLSEPMRGMIGTILECKSAQGRVRVLMDLLYQATIEVESYQVQSI